MRCVRCVRCGALLSGFEGLRLAGFAAARLSPASHAGGYFGEPSDRGALPETLGDAGFAFTIPERYTPASRAIPTAHEVAPWIATIERLWDDPDFEAKHRALAKTEARHWDRERVGEEYHHFFRGAAARSA